MSPAARAGREIRFQEARNIQVYPRIYHVYTWKDIPCIYMDMSCIYFVDIPCISLDIHSISTINICRVYPRIYRVYTIHFPYIWMRTPYIWYIPYIYQAYTKNRGSRWQYMVVHGSTCKILSLYMAVHAGTLQYNIQSITVYGSSWR